MVVSALSFLAGLLLVQQLPVLPDIKWLMVGGVLAGIIAWLRYWRCLFFVIGVLWAVLFAMRRLSDRLPEQLEGIDVPVKGYIADLPEQDEKHVRFDFIVTDAAPEISSKIRLNWYYPDREIKAGQHWSFAVRLKRVHGNMNPGGFDYERWLFTEGVGATGYVRPNPQPVLLGSDSAWNSVAVWRQSITDQLSHTFAMFAVLIFDPLAVLSAGFWLSFLAVSLIVYAVSGRLGRLGYFWGTIKINWATSVGLSPLLLLFFQQVSLIAPLANLVAVPVISLLVVPLSLLAVIVMFISPLLAGKLFFLADYALQGLWWLLVHLTKIPLASINHAQPSYWALLFAVPGILLLLAPVGIPARWLSLVMFLPLVFTDLKRPETGDINMTLLDVGQGLSVVVQTANHLLVYDTGAKFSDQSDAGQSVLLPFLRVQGVDKIDSLIISHGDNDHIGGVASLMRGIATEKVLTSVPQKLSEHSPVKCTVGQSWLWDGVRFTMLAPQQGFVSENNNSCVLKIQSEHGTVLLTGDVEAAAESWLVQTYGEALKADVLVAPHHGSKTSSTAGFLQAVQPDYVLIPAGYRNQFGHPHKDVLARYQQINAKWLNSADSGAITVNVKNNTFAVWAIRDAESKYWNFK